MVVIALEGIDGSGKTVQFERLKKKLLDDGYSVDAREFPVYSSYFGRQIGQYLTGANGVSADAIDSKSMALWFAMDRYDEFKRSRPQADVLLLNRYVLSNAVYQSIRDIDLGLPDLLEWVMELEFEKLGLPKTDLNIFLDVAITTAGDNVQKKGMRDYTGDAKDVYEANRSIQHRAREKYLEYAARLDNLHVVECMDSGALISAHDIHSLICAAIAQRGILNLK